MVRELSVFGMTLLIGLFSIVNGHREIGVGIITSAAALILDHMIWQRILRDKADERIETT